MNIAASSASPPSRAADERAGRTRRHARGFDQHLILLAAALGLLGYLTIPPILTVFYASLQSDFLGDESRWTLSHYVELFGSAVHQGIILNSLIYAGGTMAFATFSNLLKPKQFANPGLSVYRAPLGTKVHPLVSPELVAPPKAVLVDDTETVGESAEGRRARSAMAFSVGRGLQEKYESRRAKVAHQVKSWRWPRGVVMTLSPDRFSHLRNRALATPPIVGTSATIPRRASPLPTR